MKIKISNLGAIKYAEYELGKLTVICGKNNTGKTYVTHATYGLFDYLRNASRFEISNEIVNNLLTNGSAEFNFTGGKSRYLSASLDSSSRVYSNLIPDVLAGVDKHFEQAFVSVDLSEEMQTWPWSEHTSSVRLGSDSWMEIRYVSTDNCVKINIGVDSKDENKVAVRSKMSYDLIKGIIEKSIRSALIFPFIPHSFISSVERTGAAIFQKELDFTASGLVELLKNIEKKAINPAAFIRNFAGRYPLAVRRNVDFIRDLAAINNRKSFLSVNCPEILDEFADIIGGSYQVAKDGQVLYQPSAVARSPKLALVESSSAVRSLLDVGFYLHHLAMPGDLFMIDEPELNLHPENQRRLARLFARLVNAGIRVFMTTHSDYILKEFSTLIMLNRSDPRITEISQKEGYDKSELLNPSDLRVYTASEKLVLVPGAKRKKRMQTLVRAGISDELGIDTPSFDTTIDEMNRIQDLIVWGK